MHRLHYSFLDQPNGNLGQAAQSRCLFLMLGAVGYIMIANTSALSLAYVILYWPLELPLISLPYCSYTIIVLYDCRLHEYERTPQPTVIVKVWKTYKPNFSLATAQHCNLVLLMLGYSKSAKDRLGAQPIVSIVQYSVNEDEVQPT